MDLQSSSLELPQVSRSFHQDGEEICLRLCQALRKTGYPVLRNIEIHVCEGLLILKGQVPTYHMKQVAQSVAKTIDGVEGIENQVIVS